MTLDQLQVLQTIVKTGSFRAASQELHRAQSAVSYAVRTLEDEVGFSIFDRSQYRPVLTAQGKAFLKKSEDLTHQLDELKGIADFLKRGHEPVIRLAVSALWPLPKLLSALREFTKEFPQTEIKIIHDVLSNDEQILEDRADIALGHIFNDQGLLTTEELFTVNMVAVASPKHPLAKFKGKAPERELAKHTQIIMSSTVKSSNRSSGVLNPDKVISVQDYLTKTAFIKGGLGWGWMPEHMAAQEIKQKELIVAQFKKNPIKMHIARHSQKALGPCGKMIWNHFSGGQKAKLK